MTTTTNTQIVLAGFEFPAAIRTAVSFLGVLAAIFFLGLAVALAALILPFALLFTMLLGREQTGERQGWQPVPA